MKEKIDLMRKIHVSLNKNSIVLQYDYLWKQEMCKFCEILLKKGFLECIKYFGCTLHCIYQKTNMDANQNY